MDQDSNHLEGSRPQHGSQSRGNSPSQERQGIEENVVPQGTSGNSSTEPKQNTNAHGDGQESNSCSNERLLRAENSKQNSIVESGASSKDQHDQEASKEKSIQQHNDENRIREANESQDIQRGHQNLTGEEFNSRRDTLPNEEETSSSSLQPIPSQQHFATPLKALPPLKDIDPIVTPKTITIARDDENALEASSPLLHATNSGYFRDPVNLDNLSKDKIPNQQTIKEQVAAFFQTNSKELDSINENIMYKIFSKVNSIRAGGLPDPGESNLSQDAVARKIRESQRVIPTGEKDTLTEELVKKNTQIKNTDDEKIALSKENEQLREKIRINNETSTEQLDEREREIIKLNELLSKMTKAAVESNEKINNLSNEIDTVKDEAFALRLELNKSNNMATFLKSNNEWYQNLLTDTQNKYSQISRDLESKSISDATKIESMSSKIESLKRLNSSLQNTVSELQQKLEAEVSKSSTAGFNLELETTRFGKEMRSKEELLKLIQLQSTQRNERVQQLETYVDELKSNLGDAIASLEKQLTQKSEQVLELEDKLRSAEEALEADVKDDKDTTNLSLSSRNLRDGVSGVSITSDYNDLKKRFVLERSQKEKLRNQLETFVLELEARKPLIASYIDQINIYENAKKEWIEKLDNLNSEKLENEKRLNRSTNKISELVKETSSLKKLCKDLGRQLCYYLIHSSIRENNDEPLSLAEKKAIENILENSDKGEDEFDSDKIISERLVRFQSIIGLQKKNEELLTIVRHMTRQLELKDSSQKDGVDESIVDDAKDAILTLESELQNTQIKLDLITKERDNLKLIAGPSNKPDLTKQNMFLSESKEELDYKLSETEKILEDVRTDSEKAIKALTEKIERLNEENSSMSITIVHLKHSVQLEEVKFSNSQKSLAFMENQLEQLRSDVEVWKRQSRKHEDLISSKIEELRQAESQVERMRTMINNSEVEKNILTANHNNLLKEVEHFKQDNINLREDVSSLKVLLYEKEKANGAVVDKLSQMMEKCESLQEKLHEKDEKSSLLSTQSEISLKAQNSKLEQLNDLTMNLYDCKGKLNEKAKEVELLNDKVRQLYEELITTKKDLGKPEGINVVDTDSMAGASKASDETKEYSQVSIDQHKVLEESRQRNKDLEKLQTEQSVKLEALNEEKALLSNEVDVLKRKDSNFSEEKRRDEGMIKQLQLKLNDLENKTSNYQSLLNSYSSLQQENQNFREQLQKLVDIDNKYFNENKENEKLREKVKQITSEMDSLKNEYISLKEKAWREHDLFDDEKRNMQEELMLLQKRLKDDQEKNDILLNEIEFSEESSPKSSDEYLKVISYLRKEKEIVENKLNSFSQNYQDLQNQYYVVQSELGTLKSEIEKTKPLGDDMGQMTKEHNVLMEKLLLLNSLREENQKLNNESASNRSKMLEMGSQIDNLNSQIEFLRDQNREISLQVDLKEQTAKLLQEENSKYKEKLNSDTNTEKTEEINTMKQRFTNLKNEFQTKLLGHRSKAKELEKTLESLRTQLEDTKSQLLDAQNKLESGQSHEKNIESSYSNQLSLMKNERDQFSNEIENLKNQTKKESDDWSSQKIFLQNKINSLEAEIARSDDRSFETELGSVRAELEKTRDRFEEEKGKLISELQKDFERKLSEETAKISVDQAFNGKREEAGSELERIRQDISGEIREDIYKEFTEKLEKEVSKRLSEEMEKIGADQEKVRHLEETISNLKMDFESQLAKEKEDVKNMTEKKFEIKLRILNKKMEKLEQNNSGTSRDDKAPEKVKTQDQKPLTIEPSSSNKKGDEAPSGAGGSAPTKEEAPKSPGHPYNDSTLTVHRPAVDRTETTNKVAEEEKDAGDATSGQKRPMVDRSLSPSKKPKE